MDAKEFAERVESEKSTELNRLGSGQLLVVLTGADLEPAAVLAAVARSERTARETLAEWADSADGAARETFERLAEQEAEHYERVVAELEQELDSGDGSDSEEEFGSDGDAGPGEGVDPMHERLRELGDSVERAGGLVGRSLVGGRTLLQVVNFFVNEADERRADVFRDLRGDTTGNVADGTDLLAAVCEDDDDWRRARGVAESVVQVAYDDYARTLDGMGLDPKPVC